MKKIVFALTFLVSTTMFAQDKYDIFIQKIKMEEQVKDYVNNYINKLALESNGITAAQWTTIKSKIDYSPYFLGIKEVLMMNYTTEQLDEIVQANDIVSPVNDTGQFIFKPKPHVQEQFYKISRVFGKLLNVQINKQIKNLT
nr:hypothetical protein [uncultured Flavobacterium sp.]